jgi:hypothetical protein
METPSAAQVSNLELHLATWCRGLVNKKPKAELPSSTNTGEFTHVFSFMQQRDKYQLLIML